MSHVANKQEQENLSGNRSETNTWFKLTNAKLRFLFSYYGILSIVGLIITILMLFPSRFEGIFNVGVLGRALVSGVSAAIVGSTVFYIRKLYKSCIQNLVSVPTSDDDTLRSLGVFTYFLFRPWFSVIFSVLLFVILKHGIHVVTGHGTEYTVGIVYLMTMIGFFAGFAAGDLVTYVESKASEVATSRFHIE